MNKPQTDAGLRTLTEDSIVNEGSFGNKSATIKDPGNPGELYPLSAMTGNYNPSGTPSNTLKTEPDLRRSPLYQKNLLEANLEEAGVDINSLKSKKILEAMYKYKMGIPPDEPLVKEISIEDIIKEDREGNDQLDKKEIAETLSHITISNARNDLIKDLGAEPSNLQMLNHAFGVYGIDPSETEEEATDKYKKELYPQFKANTSQIADYIEIGNKAINTPLAYSEINPIIVAKSFYSSDANPVWALGRAAKDIWTSARNIYEKGGGEATKAFMSDPVDLMVGLLIDINRWRVADQVLKEGPANRIRDDDFEPAGNFGLLTTIGGQQLTDERKYPSIPRKTKGGSTIHGMYSLGGLLATKSALVLDLYESYLNELTGLGVFKGTSIPDVEGSTTYNNLRAGLLRSLVPEDKLYAHYNDLSEQSPTPDKRFNKESVQEIKEIYDKQSRHLDPKMGIRKEAHNDGLGVGFTNSAIPVAQKFYAELSDMFSPENLQNRPSDAAIDILQMSGQGPKGILAVLAKSKTPYDAVKRYKDERKYKRDHPEAAVIRDDKGDIRLPSKEGKTLPVDKELSQDNLYVGSYSGSVGPLSSADDFLRLAREDPDALASEMGVSPVLVKSLVVSIMADPKETKMVTPIITNEFDPENPSNHGLTTVTIKDPVEVNKRQAFSRTVDNIFYTTEGLSTTDKRPSDRAISDKNTPGNITIRANELVVNNTIIAFLNLQKKRDGNYENAQIELRNPERYPEYNRQQNVTKIYDDTAHALTKEMTKNVKDLYEDVEITLSIKDQGKRYSINVTGAADKLKSHHREGIEIIENLLNGSIKKEDFIELGDPIDVRNPDVAQTINVDGKEFTNPRNLVKTGETYGNKDLSLSELDDFVSYVNTLRNSPKLEDIHPYLTIITQELKNGIHAKLLSSDHNSAETASDIIKQRDRNYEAENINVRAFKQASGITPENIQHITTDKNGESYTYKATLQDKEDISNNLVSIFDPAEGYQAALAVLRNASVGTDLLDVVMINTILSQQVGGRSMSSAYERANTENTSLQPTQTKKGARGSTKQASLNYLTSGFRRGREIGGVGGTLGVAFGADLATASAVAAAGFLAFLAQTKIDAKILKRNRIRRNPSNQIQSYASVSSGSGPKREGLESIYSKDYLEQLKDPQIEAAQKDFDAFRDQLLREGGPNKLIYRKFANALDKSASFPALLNHLLNDNLLTEDQFKELAKLDKALNNNKVYVMENGRVMIWKPDKNNSHRWIEFDPERIYNPNKKSEGTKQDNNINSSETTTAD